MKWENQRESDNVEDRRYETPTRRSSGLLGGKISLTSVVIAVVAGYFLGVNPLTILGFLSGNSTNSVTQSSPQSNQPRSQADDHLAKFVSVVLADTEDVWKTVFSEHQKRYQEPHLVLFRDSTPTQCGKGQAAMGPFYCPADQKVYIDLGFYEVLKNRLGAPGDFAQAYVVAHEVGHHVQNLLGISEQVDQQRGRISQTAYNALSVRLELQADCFAGVWAKRADQHRQILESGDVESAMNAAARIGDDALQASSKSGRVVPESFTHGTSAQRQRWFSAGLKSGDLNSCDTFKASNL